MNRWKVWREWPLPSETPDAWEPWRAWDGEHLYSAQFRTHAEALAYADKQARTREVVLPRPQLNEDGRVEFDFTEWSGLDYTPGWLDGATYDRRTGPNTPAFGPSEWIPREHWKPLANALLALAEQEEA